MLAWHEVRALTSPFDRQREYWEERLARSFGPAATGMQAYGDPFNRWLYRVIGVRFRHVVNRLHLRLTDSEVLDVGCGTGFLLRQWIRMGAAHVTGVDIAPTAITRLAPVFPECSLFRADVSEAPNPLPANRFLAISAFAVLFHIVDDARYRRALENIHAALVPGGWFVFSDNFIHSSRPPMGDYHVCRTREAIERTLAETGFDVVDRAPLFVLLGDPVDSDSRWLHRYWRALSWIVMRSHLTGGLLGGALFPLELLLTRSLRESPTTEIMVCRKAECGAPRSVPGRR